MAITTKSPSGNRPLSAMETLEQKILESPEVRKKLEELTQRRFPLGRFPVIVAVDERLKLAKFHITNGKPQHPLQSYETPGEFVDGLVNYVLALGRKSDKAPKIKYERLQALISDLREYVPRFFVAFLGSHIKSFFVGRDLYRNVPSSLDDSRQGLTEKVGSENPQQAQAELAFHSASLSARLKGYVLFIPKELRRFGRHLAKVRNNISHDAKSMYWVAKAREFARNSSTTMEPEFMRSLLKDYINPFIDNSFSGVLQARNGGFEKNLEGKLEVDLGSGNVICSTHHSMWDFVIDPYVLGKKGIYNTTILAGSNLSNLLGVVGREEAEKLRMTFPRAGIKFVERELSRSRKAALYYSVLGAVIGISDLPAGNVIHYGNGREQGEGGRKWKLDTPLTKFFLNYSRAVYFSSKSYEIVPDDFELAHPDKRVVKGGGSSFGVLFSTQSEKGRYGEVYWNLGKKPILTSDYLPTPTDCMFEFLPAQEIDGKLHAEQQEQLKRCEAEFSLLSPAEQLAQQKRYEAEFMLLPEAKQKNIYEVTFNRLMRKFENDARQRAIELVTLSSTYLLAAAVKNSCLVEFSVGQATGLVSSLLVAIDERNRQYAEAGVDTRVFIAPKLAEGNLSDAVRDAAEKLASRGALVKKDGAYSVGGAAMLNFYAAKGEAPLRAHGVMLA